MSQADPQYSYTEDSAQASSIIYQYVTPSAIPLCNCGKRYACEQCRRSWIAKRAAAAIRWISEAPGANHRYTTLLSIGNSDDWHADAQRLWKYWSKMGAMRSAHKKWKRPGGMAAVVRGVAGMHMIRGGTWGAHLHAVFACTCDAREAIDDAWYAITQGGYAEPQITRDLGGSIGYEVGGEIPAMAADKQRLADAMRGVKLVRYMGR